MIKHLFTLLLICTLSIVNAQNIEKELELIETAEQAEEYIEAKKSKKNKLVAFNEERHKTKLAKELFTKKIGGTVVVEREFEKVYYKIISKTTSVYNRVASIYLDGNDYSKEELNTIRKNIISKYKSGVPFNVLAKEFSMDQNAVKGGDLGWFTKGKLDTDLEKNIVDETREVNDIYMVDLPETNRYYVVLKTHEPKEISEIQALKIVEKK